MSKLTQKELDEALMEMYTKVAEEQELNWDHVRNVDLRVGMRVATTFDKKTGRAKSSTKITKIDVDPMRHKGKLHIWGEHSNINWCYDFSGSTKVML